MKKIFCFLIIGISLFVFSCAMFDDSDDIFVSVNPPDELSVFNNARVSTLRSLDGKIMRANIAVYTFHFDVDIPANNLEIIKIDDFIMQAGDKPRVTKAHFSWDM